MRQYRHPSFVTRTTAAALSTVGRMVGRMVVIGWFGCMVGATLLSAPEPSEPFFSAPVHSMAGASANAKANAKANATSKDTNFDGTRTYDHCAIEFGTAGLVPVGLRDECRLMECPPGTAGDPKRSGRCTRTGSGGVPGVVDMDSDRRDSCSARPYDWWLTPHHHLGNKYRRGPVAKPPGDGGGAGSGGEVATACYRPCPFGTVPHSTNDPVSGTALLGDDESGKCVPTELYMAGAYRDSPAYCASAWVRRLGKTARENLDETEAPLRAHSNKPFRRTETHGEASAVARADAQHDMLRGGIRVVPDGREYALAGSRACDVQDEVRAAEVRGICEAVRDDPDRELLLEEEYGPRAGPARVQMLKAYCDRMFCTPDGAAGNRTCFPDAVRFAKNSPGYDADADMDAVADAGADASAGGEPPLVVYKDTGMLSIGIDRIRDVTYQVSVSVIVLALLAAAFMYVKGHAGRFLRGLFRGFGWL